MSDQNMISWKRNQFLKFYAKMKIRVGGASPIDINKGDEFEYDGTIVKYAGMELNQPQMRGAISAGWASLNVTGEEVVNPVNVPRSVAVAKTVNTDLSRVQRRDPDLMNSDSLDERTILNVKDRHEGNSVKALRPNTDLASSQEGKTIGRIKTSTRLAMDVSTQQAGNVINHLENGNWGRPEYNQKVTKEGVEISSNLKSMSSQINTEESEGQVIGQVRNSNKESEEGIKFNNKQDSVVSDLMQQIEMLKNQVAAMANNKPDPIPANVDPRIRVARTIDKNFPLDWDFSGKLADRMERAKNHGISDAFLEALFAAEGDQMRKLLKREYPEKFGND